MNLKGGETMQYLWREEDGVFEVMTGSSIEPTIAEAITLAVEREEPVTFKFNGVTVTVESNSDPQLIYRDWRRALDGCIERKIGPYPIKELSEGQKERDAHIRALEEKRKRKREAESEAQKKTRREKLEDKLSKAPSLRINNKGAWQAMKENNQDPYGKAVIDYAERWGRLMQLGMEKGKELEEIAEDTLHEADIGGITGCMHGMAVSTLAEHWKHGEQLRQWHNLDVQVGNEGEEANESGGVINSAMLTIKKE